MKKTYSKESSSVVKGILGFLSDRGKSNLLSSVAEVLDEAADKTKHADEIVITSAVPLLPPEQKKIGALVSDFLNNKLPVRNTVDRRIVGGFTIRVGDFFLDASLHAEIENMKYLLMS